MTYGQMDTILKPLPEVGLPDPRFKFIAVESADGIRPFAISDMHANLELVVLHAGVPGDVVRQFHVARNLMLYSWFVFEFHTIAERHAYATLELALNVRLGHPKKEPTKKKPLMLRELLKMATDRGLLEPEKLPSWERIQARQDESQNHPCLGVEPMSATEWFTNVQKSLPDLRNDLSHGGFRLYFQASLSQMELCMDLINALFPPNEKQSEPPITSSERSEGAE